MLGYFKRPRVQSIAPGDRLPAEAGGLLFNRRVAGVTHTATRHDAVLGKLVALFVLEDGTKVEFFFGRGWRRA